MLSDVMLHLSKVGKRQESFLILIDHLMKCENPNIVETGTMRTPDNYEGDGMSTLLWYNVLKTLGKGRMLSIDIDPEATKFARSLCKPVINNDINVNIITNDSVSWLEGHLKYGPNKPIDVLYLDSYDLQFPDPTPSFIHTLYEFMVAKQYLAPNALICVDDNVPVLKNDVEIFVSKGEYIKQFMDQVGNPPIYSGYQIIWRNKA